MYISLPTTRETPEMQTLLLQREGGEDKRKQVCTIKQKRGQKVSLRPPVSSDLAGECKGLIWRRRTLRDIGTCLHCLPACLPVIVPAACLSPASESEQSRTSVDESGNRHREVLSKPWASSSVNWTVVSRTTSMVGRMSQQRPERICSRDWRKGKKNTYKKKWQSYILKKIILGCSSYWKVAVAVCLFVKSKLWSRGVKCKVCGDSQCGP